MIKTLFVFFGFKLVPKNNNMIVSKNKKFFLKRNHDVTKLYLTNNIPKMPKLVTLRKKLAV